MIWVWGVARQFGAKILFRMEDRDPTRAKPEFVRALLDDAQWLGFRWDNELTDDYWQSKSDAAYGEALAPLQRRGLVYRCDCSRKDIAAHSVIGPGGERVYSGYCRDRDVPEEVPHGLRVRIEPGSESFRDLALGEQTQIPAEQCGDLLVRERRGQWTYQYAATVDDMRHGVDLVIRGEDLLSSTGRQIRLAKMLGRKEIPSFLHHPLVLDGDGAKLSKRWKAEGIRVLRDSGMSAAEILGKAAQAVGLIEAPRDLAQHDLPALIERRIRPSTP